MCAFGGIGLRVSWGRVRMGRWGSRRFLGPRLHIKALGIVGFFVSNSETLSVCVRVLHSNRVTVTPLRERKRLESELA